MTNHEELVLQQIRNYLIDKHFTFEEPINPKSNFESFGLDSLDKVELSMYLEEKIGLNCIDGEECDTVEELITHVTKMLNER